MRKFLIIGISSLFVSIVMMLMQGYLTLWEIENGNILITPLGHFYFTTETVLGIGGFLILLAGSVLYIKRKRSSPTKSNPES